MVKDVVDPDVNPADEDVEGNAFKWDIQQDAKGRSRLKQGWDPADGPAGTRQPTRSGIEDRPPKEGR